MGEQPGPAPKSIELRIEDISQLFHTLDPFPFRERDLDKDVEEFIDSWGREMPEDQPLEIVVHLPQAQASRPEAQELDAAFRRYFDNRAQATSRDLRELFRIGRRALAIGLAVLSSSVIVSQTAAAYLKAASGRPFHRRKPDALWLGRELEIHRNISVRLVAGGSSMQSLSETFGGTCGAKAIQRLRHGGRNLLVARQLPSCAKRDFGT